MDTGMAIPDLSFYTPAQLQALKDAVVAERLRRFTGGTITTGGKNGKNYGVQIATESELADIEKELARRLGSRGPTKRRIAFPRNSNR